MTADNYFRVNLECFPFDSSDRASLVLAHERALRSQAAQVTRDKDGHDRVPRICAWRFVHGIHVAVIGDGL